MTHFDRKSRRERSPRGLALILVLAVIALAAVLGFAMLSTASLQAQVSGNATRAAASEYLAESAVQAGLYYLQYPALVPADWATTPGYYIKAADQTLGAAIPGTFDLEVKQTVKRDVYTLRALGRASPVAVPRIITATVAIERARITGAGFFGGNVTIPLRSSVTGHVQANGTIANVSALPLVSWLAAPLPKAAFEAPTSATINYYGADTADGRYVCPDGTVGYAQQLLSPPLVPPVAVANNPGKVFYYKNTMTPDLLLSAPITIDGTLVVKDGGVSVRAANVMIRPVDGFPALLCDRDLNMYRTAVGLKADGVVWVGRHITWTGPLNTGSTMEINGALLMPAGSVIGTPLIGGANVIVYASANVNVPDLKRTPQPGNSVKVLTWNE